MCELFSGDFGTLHTDHPHFTFVDADNARKGFERSLRSRGFNDEEMERFSMERVFDYLNSNRNYLFSAIASQSDPPEWIKKLRGLEGFVFREGLLTQRQDGKLQQKGVDVLLAVEAMKLSSRRKVGSITIFSSDGDFLPLVRALVDEGITTNVASFDDPNIGETAGLFRDNADKYYHIGGHILLFCHDDFFPQGGRYFTWGALEEIGNKEYGGYKTTSLFNGKRMERMLSFGTGEVGLATFEGQMDLALSGKLSPAINVFRTTEEAVFARRLFGYRK